MAEKPLESLYISSAVRSLPIALRWYMVGLQSQSNVDAFISYFIGLEAIANGYFAELSPQPIREDYTRLKEYFAEAQPMIDSRLRTLALNRLKDFPLLDKFSQYWAGRFGSETPESREFLKLHRIRSEILHGKPRYASSQHMHTLRKLLEQSLAKELEISDIVAARQAGPTLLEQTLSYVIVPQR